MESKRDDRPGRQGKRRKFTDEFKAGATRLVLDENKTIAQVARDLDVTASVQRRCSCGHADHGDISASSSVQRRRDEAEASLNAIVRRL
jgi:transposase-like protein